MNISRIVTFFVKYRLITAVLFYILWGYGFFTRIFQLDPEVAEALKWSCRLLLFLFWVIILADMIKTRIRNKVFWLISMFLLPFMAPVVYLFRRNNLIHLRSNKFSGDQDAV